MITHPSANLAGRGVTSLIETNALPLSQAAFLVSVVCSYVCVVISYCVLKFIANAFFFVLMILLK